MSNPVKDTTPNYGGSSGIDILSDICRRIDKVDNPAKYIPSENPHYINQMTNKMAIRCTVSDCNENVPYEYIRNDISSCRKCTKKCDLCKDDFHPDEMSDGLYSHCCIDCTRCERCDAIVWDYNCSNCGY